MVDENNVNELKFCPHCRSKKQLKPFGTVRNNPRWLCVNCMKSTIKPLDKPRER